MTADGRFRQPLRPSLPVQIGLVAAVVAVLAGAIAAAGLVLWAALTLIPVAIAAAAIAWIAFRIQMWRVRRAAAGRRAVYPYGR